MNIRQALQIAVRYETRIRDALREAETVAVDDRTRRVLTLIAKQEQKHLEVVRNAQKVLSEKGRLDQFDPLHEPDWPEAKFSLVKVKGALADASQRQRVAELLEHLLEMETETYKFYRDLGEQLTGKQKAYFERFIENEREHVNMIGRRLDELVRDVSYTPD